MLCLKTLGQYIEGLDYNSSTCTPILVILGFWQYMALSHRAERLDISQ